MSIVWVSEPTPSRAGASFQAMTAQLSIRRNSQSSPGRWHGHLPEATLALGTLLERAATGGAPFSAAERALFMACEFWVAVEMQALEAHLGADPLNGLRYLSLVFGAIGTQAVARALQSGIRGLEGAASSAARQQCLVALQAHLARTHDPVDRLIAELARSLGMAAPAEAAYRDLPEPMRMQA